MQSKADAKEKTVLVEVKQSVLRAKKSKRAVENETSSYQNSSDLRNIIINCRRKYDEDTLTKLERHRQTNCVAG